MRCLCIENPWKLHWNQEQTVSYLTWDQALSRVAWKSADRGRAKKQRLSVNRERSWLSHVYEPSLMPINLFHSFWTDLWSIILDPGSSNLWSLIQFFQETYWTWYIWYTRHSSGRKVIIKIAFMTVYCTQFAYVDNYLKNTYYSCQFRSIGNMLLLYFFQGFLFM